MNALNGATKAVIRRIVDGERIDAPDSRVIEYVGMHVEGGFEGLMAHPQRDAGVRVAIARHHQNQQRHRKVNGQLLQRSRSAANREENS
jgi:hypothetical protein